jgi:hypothetical protein
MGMTASARRTYNRSDIAFVPYTKPVYHPSPAIRFRQNTKNHIDAERLLTDPPGLILKTEKIQRLVYNLKIS